MLAPPTLLCWKISYCIHVSTGGKASVRVLLSTWERVPSLLQCYGDGWPAQLLHAPINWQMFPMCVFPLHIAGDPLYSICSELTVQAVMSQNSIFGQWFVPQWRFLERFSTPPRRNVLEQHSPACCGVHSDSSGSNVAEFDLWTVVRSSVTIFGAFLYTATSETSLSNTLLRVVVFTVIVGSNAD